MQQAGGPVHKESRATKIAGLIVLVPLSLSCLFAQVPPAQSVGVRCLGVLFAAAFFGLLYAIIKRPRRVPASKPFERDGILCFNYFKAPQMLVGDNLKPDIVCHLCGQSGHCLRLPKLWREPNYRIFVIPNFEEAKTRLESAAAGSNEYRICLDCLANGKVLYCHLTDMGKVLPEGFAGRKPTDSQKNFPRRAIDELLRTPPIAVEQAETWLTHCNDFMDFVGTWAREDFAKHATDGDGEKLYYDMRSVDKETDKNWAEWDSAGETYYAFRCRHCQKYSGYYQLD